MHKSERLRLLACIAPPLIALSVATVVACSDATRPSSLELDHWAGSTVVGMQVRSELTILANGSPVGRKVGTNIVSLPVMSWGTPSIRTDRATPEHPETIVRHFKNKSGTTTSIGLHFARSGGPPNLIYVFENGRIQAIVSPQYERRGAGFIRTKARLTFFSKDGTPVAQVDQSNAATSAITNMRRAIPALTATAARDIAQVFLPKPLYAEDGAVGCLSEWVGYTTTSLALAAATTGLLAEAPLCISTGVGCAAAGTLFLVWSAALDKWNIALDKLATCIKKNSTSNDGQVTSGGSAGGDQALGGGTEDTSIWHDVDLFIRRSIASGNFWCTADLNYCIYYSS